MQPRAGMIAMSPRRRLLVAIAILVLVLGIIAYPFRPRDVVNRVADGSALATVRAAVDGSRECAPLLGGIWPIEFSADSLDTRAVDALVAAGLLVRRPLPDTGDGRAHQRMVATSLGQHWIRLVNHPHGLPPSPLLCFGRRQVIDVRAVRRRDILNPGQTTDPAVEWRYQIVDVPAWARRADMRHAFPLLAQADRPLPGTSVGWLPNGPLGRLALAAYDDTDPPQAGVPWSFDLCGPGERTSTPACR